MDSMIYQVNLLYTVKQNVIKTKNNNLEFVVLLRNIILLQIREFRGSCNTLHND